MRDLGSSSVESGLLTVVPERAQEACGVVGFLTHTEDATDLTYYGLQTVQNRGKDAAGIAVSHDESISVIVGRGEVSEAFNKRQSLLGHFGVRLAMGHVLYSTDKTSRIQPFNMGDFAFAHNGQLTNARALAKHYKIPTDSASDSELLARIIASKRDELGDTETALDEVLPKISGSFSALIMEKDRLIAFRDRRGFRPLSIGMTADGGYGVASETAVFDVLDGEPLRAVEPGTYDVITREGIQTHRWMQAAAKVCGMELAYFARPDSTIDGIEVAVARENMGKLLAQDYPVDADIVVPMPDSGRQAADGLSEESGIPHKNGFFKNGYIGRTYNMATGSARKISAAIKNNPIKSVVRGKDLVVVDDSIVRGTTVSQTIQRLRQAGASAVHLRIAFPAIKSPCFYGVNMQQKDGLIAAVKTAGEIMEEVGADSLGYLSPERFAEAVGVPLGRLCLACATGEYPEPVPGEDITQPAVYYAK